MDCEDVKLLRRIPGYGTFDPAKETLDMVKPIYGLKDAPRAWRQKLHLLLVEWGLKRLYADAELYVCHEAVGAGAMPQYVALPGPTSKPKQVKWSDQQKDTPTEVGKRRRLRLVLSTHVDDLKGAAKRPVAESLLSFLE